MNRNTIQLKLPFAETEKSYQKMWDARDEAAKERAAEGISKAEESTMHDKLVEVARYASQGYKPGQIAAALCLSGQQITKLVNKARERGLIDQMHAERNAVNREMWVRRTGIARTSYELVQKRLNHAKNKRAGEIDSRDVKDAFAALKVTEYTVEDKPAAAPPMNVNVGLFPPNVVKRANEASDTIFDIEK